MLSKALLPPLAVGLVSTFVNFSNDDDGDAPEDTANQEYMLTSGQTLDAGPGNDTITTRGLVSNVNASGGDGDQGSIPAPGSTLQLGTVLRINDFNPAGDSLIIDTNKPAGNSTSAPLELVDYTATNGPDITNIEVTLRAADLDHQVSFTISLRGVVNPDDIQLVFAELDPIANFSASV